MRIYRENKSEQRHGSAGRFFIRRIYGEILLATGLVIRSHERIIRIELLPFDIVFSLVVWLVDIEVVTLELAERLYPTQYV